MISTNYRRKLISSLFYYIEIFGQVSSINKRLVVAPPGLVIALAGTGVVVC